MLSSEVEESADFHAGLQDAATAVYLEWDHAGACTFRSNSDQKSSSCVCDTTQAWETVVAVLESDGVLDRERCSTEGAMLWSCVRKLQQHGQLLFMCTLLNECGHTARLVHTPEDAFSSPVRCVSEKIAIGDPREAIDKWLYVTHPFRAAWIGDTAKNFENLASRQDKTFHELRKSLRTYEDSGLAARFADMLLKDVATADDNGSADLFKEDEEVEPDKLKLAASKMHHRTGDPTQMSTHSFVGYMVEFDTLSLKVWEPELARIATIHNGETSVADAERLCAGALRAYNNAMWSVDTESTHVPRFACGAIVRRKTSSDPSPMGVIYGLNDFCSAALYGGLDYGRDLPMPDDLHATANGEPVYSMIKVHGHFAAREADLEVLSCRACGIRTDSNNFNHGQLPMLQIPRPLECFLRDDLEGYGSMSLNRLFRKKKNGGKCGLVPARVMTSPGVLARWPAIPGACADRDEECGDNKGANLTLKVLDEQIFRRHEA